MSLKLKNKIVEKQAKVRRKSSCKAWEIMGGKKKDDMLLGEDG